MSVEEVFSIWKKQLDKDSKCIYRPLVGGPGLLDFDGCHLSKHSEVTYAELCPNECTDFIEKSNDDLFAIFLQLYSYHRKYYNNTYEIDSNDPYYIN